MSQDVSYEKRVSELEKENQRLKNELEKYKIERTFLSRENTEDIQQENERQFRQLADAMPHLVWITRPDGYHEYFNERWYEFTGTHPGETYGHLWSSFLHPDDYQRSVDVWNKSLKTGEPYSIEYRFKRGSDGTYHWFLGRAMPVHNDQGEITRWFGTCTNIQMLKEAQRAAQENYERYQLVNIATHDIIWDWNLLTNQLDWNQVVERALGAKLSEMGDTVQSWHHHIHPEDRDQVIKSIQKAIDNGEITWNAEYRFGPKNGPWRTYLDRGFIARDLNGKAYRMIGSMLDLTEQKKVEEAVRKKENLLRNVLEALPVGVFVADEKGNITTTNSVAEKIWGGAKHVTIDQLHEYKGWWRHSGEKIEAMDWAFARAFLKGETSVNEEIDIKCFDGSLKTILNSAVPVKNEKGDIISAVAVNSDITQKIKDEEALRETNERLKIAGELHENLLYIIAHDLRGPMANMRLVLDLINKENNENSKIQMMSSLGEMLNRQENILEGLVDLIKVQSPDDIKPSEIDLVDLVNDIIKENEVALMECDGVIHIDFQEIPKIIHIQSFVYSILKNLITNAIKYRDSGRNLEVNVQSTRKNGFVLVTVKDNGIGFNLQKYSKDLFRPFKRFTKQASGTGIGLYIIKHLIVKNGGNIDVESEPGKGSSFYCYFKEYK